MRPRLANRVIVVTGAASGIGAATARRAAREGATVILADISADGIEALSRELESAGRQASCFPIDVRCPESTRALAVWSLSRHRRVDAVVNCAGIVCPGGIESLDEATVRRQIDVNFLGTVLVTQAFLPHFRACQRGHFLHLSSLGGIAPMPGEAVYSATKFAVRGFCLALDMELQESGIQVSVICPDSVNTPQLETEAVGHGSSLSFGGSVLEPEEVAAVVADTLVQPAREVLVPRLRGSLTKLVNLSPRVMASIYPVLDRLGEKAREEFVEELRLRRAS
jgi:3-oxoacyl-[acyl-carrier protein] reductase